MLNHSLQITVPMTIAIVSALSIGGYALINSNDFNYLFRVQFKEFVAEVVFNRGQNK